MRSRARSGGGVWLGCAVLWLGCAVLWLRARDVVRAQCRGVVVVVDVQLTIS